ncbi:Propionyl-CoA carboxylase alpha chain, mitochondrial [Trichinella sp. T9]|nr:Propionyl-CoA carboxylase alpha chain, mitochondrial [Trichinella sp. T9]
MAMILFKSRPYGCNYILRRCFASDRSMYVLDPINPEEKKFQKILIANRGEIACRIIKTCKAMGIKTVAVHSDVDSLALHVQMADEAVCIGPAPARDSYLRMDKILQAVKDTGAEAVHPGYGFLSENTEFARLLTEAGGVFIGPNSKAVLAMGDKIQSKRIATEAKVSMIPGFDGEIKDAEMCVKVANEIGYPVMIKASAGGGGKGMRIAWNDKEAREGFRLSQQEAASSFGDDRMLVLCDKHGNAIWLNERECSIQRRNQKVIEESPSPFVPPEMRKKMGDEACALALAVGYDSAGTVEFLVDSKRNFYFLEMNTRLQVEHPITEAVTGVDIVQQMIRIAYGHKLNLKQSDIPIRGWALECRVYAEDPYKSFGLPSVGRLTRYEEPLRLNGIRCDSGIYEGSEISIYYDPLICKLIAYANDRIETINLMRDALDEYVIRGVTNNIPLLRDIMSEERYRSGNITTKYLFETYPEGFHGVRLNDEETRSIAAVAAALFTHHRHRAVNFLNSLQQDFSKNTQSMNEQMLFVKVPHIDREASQHKISGVEITRDSCTVTIDGKKIHIEGPINFCNTVLNLKVNGKPCNVQIKSCDTAGRISLLYKGCPYDLNVTTSTAEKYYKYMPPPKKVDLSNVIVAPMPGMIKSVSVKVGQAVSESQETCVIEAMKMQNSLLAPKSGKTPLEQRASLEEVEEWLAKYDRDASQLQDLYTVQLFQYRLELSKGLLEEFRSTGVKVIKHQLDARSGALKFLANLPKNVSVETVRQLRLISAQAAVDFGIWDVVLDKSKKRFVELPELMLSGYSRSFACENQTTVACCQHPIALYPNLIALFSNNRTYDTLFPLWYSWGSSVQSILENQFVEFVNLANQGARSVDYENYYNYMESSYERPLLQTDLLQLYQSTLPIFEHLHAYVRRKLIAHYGTSRLPASVIEAHLLGDLWAERWDALFDLTVPYKFMPTTDVTNSLKALNYTVESLFRLADSWLQSAGFVKAPDSLWRLSTFQRFDTNTSQTCIPTAWQFHENGMHRVTTCAGEVSTKQLLEAFRLLGRVQYFIQYRDRPLTFRRQAGPGFMEAIGDTLALFALNPASLERLGLLFDNSTRFDVNHHHVQLNYLLRVALTMLPSIPYHFALNHWQKAMFDGTISAKTMNIHWSIYRYQYSGIGRPMPSATLDVHGTNHWSVFAVQPAYANLIGTVLSFQLFQGICRTANHTGPLHRCNLDSNPLLGRQLSNLMRLGATKPWQEALKLVSKKALLSAEGMLEFFEPLHDWLKRENEKAHECYGWNYKHETAPAGAAAVVGARLQKPRCGDFLPTNQNFKAEQFYNNYEAKQLALEREVRSRWWDYATNITEHNLIRMTESMANKVAFVGEAARRARAEIYLPMVDDDRLARMIRLVRSRTLQLNAVDTAELNRLIGGMTSTFSRGRICSWRPFRSTTDCKRMWSLNPDLTNLFANCHDYKTLLYAWQAWHDVVGRPIRGPFERALQLGNRGARAIGYDDVGDYWRAQYENDYLKEELASMWQQLLPLYEQLHAYVRRRLRYLYPGQFNCTAIPAHLFGNIWAESWVNLFPLVAPYSKAPQVDVSEEMCRQRFTPERMFRLAESFFSSVGLPNMTRTFWQKSYLERPDDGRNFICHASAWDMFHPDDFRIKMCTQVTMADLIVAHHEMGHVHYFMQYADQPSVFRSGANPGFHEAIGDTIALSVATPSHLRLVGLYKGPVDDAHLDVNFLLKQALEKVAFLPFGYLVDLWRWNVFRGVYSADQWNREWWRLRHDIQGILPAVERPRDSFDPGAKFHVASSTPYIRYFIAHVLQFQLYKALCQFAGHSRNHGEPLHRCDFYNSTVAGEKLALMLQLGSSRHWRQALRLVTGEQKLSVEPLKEYFQPLMDWLREENKNECFGWGRRWPEHVQSTLMKPRCGAFQPPDQVELELIKLKKFLENFQILTSSLQREIDRAHWKRWTDAGNGTLLLRLLNSTTEKALVLRNQARQLATMNYSLLFEPTDLEMVDVILHPDTPNNDDDIRLMNELLLKMASIGDGAFIRKCQRAPASGVPNGTDDQIWYLIPDLMNLVSRSSVDVETLTYVWKQWRDTVGKRMFPLYEKYVLLTRKVELEKGTVKTDHHHHQMDQVEQLTSELLPLYEHLHTYVRRKLMVNYRDNFATSSIPAHLLGSMFAEDWSNLLWNVNFTTARWILEVDQSLRRKNFTVTGMFKQAEVLFRNVGLDNLTEQFWQKSIFEQKKKNPSFEKRLLCRPAVWRFPNDDQYRIGLCATVDVQQFLAAHSTLARVHHLIMQSELQPVSSTWAGNWNVADVVSLLVRLLAENFNYLKSTDMIPAKWNYTIDDELQLLLFQALRIVPSLPYYLAISRWRAQLADTSTAVWQRSWWDIRNKYQGISVPVERQATDFDPGANVDVFLAQSTVDSFFAAVAHFQVFKSLCDRQNHKGPLHRCNLLLDHGQHVGQTLQNVLVVPSGRNLSTLLNSLTGNSEVSTAGLLEYFQPLFEWLKTENTDDCFGWGYQWPAEINDSLPQPRCDRVLPVDPVDVETAKVSRFLNSFEKHARLVNGRLAWARWIYRTNSTDLESRIVALEQVELEHDKFYEQQANATGKFKFDLIQNPLIIRQLYAIKDRGMYYGAENGLRILLNSMRKIYDTMYFFPLERQTPVDNGSLRVASVDDDRRQLVNCCNDYTEMYAIWENWHGKIGAKMKPLFEQYVQLAKLASNKAGYVDMGYWWQSRFERDNFVQHLQQLWYRVLPLYERIHARVRRLFIRRFPNKFANSSIPAHVFGTYLFDQNCADHFDHQSLPYPELLSLNATEVMISRNYTAHHLFKMAESFYESLGFPEMNDAFWNISVLHYETTTNSTPKDCRPLAVDFSNGLQYAIYMCTDVSVDGLVEAHRQMARLHHYMTCAEQPSIFRHDTGIGFFRAISDAVALSIGTPTHLSRIGLLNISEEDVSKNMTDMNYLYKAVVRDIVSLPAGYVIDLYMWNVFNGKISPEELDEAWWRLRTAYQGIIPPAGHRYSGLDAAAEWRISNHEPMVGNFVATILKFQLYKAFCEAAGHSGPLHRCDLSNSKAVGRLLKALMKPANSSPWFEILEQLFNISQLSVEPIFEYYQPIVSWLEQEEEGGKNDECFGWGEQWPSAVEKTLPIPRCGITMDDDTTDGAEQELIRAENYLASYEQRAQSVYEDYARKRWLFLTDMVDHNRKLYVEAEIVKRLFDAEQASLVLSGNFNFSSLASVNQQVVSVLERIVQSGLKIEETQAKALASVSAQLRTLHSTTFICAVGTANMANCPHEDRLYLEPDLVELMAKSTDPSVLQYLWQRWHQAIDSAAIGPSLHLHTTISNAIVRRNNFPDLGAYWRSLYRDANLERTVESLWIQILPLYEQMHAYVRRMLHARYPDSFNTSAVPVHLFGDMFASNWLPLYANSIPYPNVSTASAWFDERLTQNFTAEYLLKMAEKFFLKIGLLPLTEQFWNSSIVNPNRDKRSNMECHAGTADFFNRIDYALKSCTGGRYLARDFLNAFEQVGQVEFSMICADQRLKFREDDESGLREAIINMVVLTATTPLQLRDMGLIVEGPFERGSSLEAEEGVNFLYFTALQKLASLAFAYAADLYRWRLFNGSIPQADYNDHWWLLKYQYQGLVAPTGLLENLTSYHAASEHHIANNEPLLRLFVANVLQFQLQKSLCLESGHRGPLYQCNPLAGGYAGRRLKRMLRTVCSTGSFADALRTIATNISHLSAEPLLEYFQPLQRWLETENALAMDCYGWNHNWTTIDVTGLVKYPRCGFYYYYNGSSSAPGRATGSYSQCKSFHCTCSTLADEDRLRFLMKQAPPTHQPTRCQIKKMRAIDAISLQSI